MDSLFLIVFEIFLFYHDEAIQVVPIAVTPKGDKLDRNIKGKVASDVTESVRDVFLRSWIERVSGPV